MKKTSLILKDILITFLILFVCFALCLVLHNIFKDDSLIPAIFILASFLVSVLTKGYVYGLAAAAAGVFLVNYAFTFPFFVRSSAPENIVSAIIMIFVAFITCALTTKIKHQEVIKAESEKERMRANLLRAVSHDLRTPLTTIYGSSSAILENSEQLSEEQKTKMLIGINNDAEWLCRMVENLLSITKLDSGNVKIIKTPTVLDELVDSVLIKFKRRYPQQEVLVDLPDEMVVIPMDPLLIEQVAVNILENAVMHAEGMTKLSFKVFTISDKAIFEIQDNGCGIDPDRLKTIFSGYYTSRDSRTDSKKNNAGIGLSVCASIIKAHGGDIRAGNMKDGGAVFRFTLDREDEEYEQ